MSDLAEALHQLTDKLSEHWHDDYWLDATDLLLPERAAERIAALEQEKYDTLYENAHLKHRIAALKAENKQLKRKEYYRNQHCDTCGLTWIDDGLNTVGCPYCKITELKDLISELNAENKRLKMMFDGLSSVQRWQMTKPNAIQADSNGLWVKWYDIKGALEKAE